MEILSAPPSSQSSITATGFHFSVLPQLLSAVRLLFLLLPLTYGAETSYSAHCSAVVRDQPLLPDPNPSLLSPRFLALRQAHVYINGDNRNRGVSVIPRSLSLFSRKAYSTQNDAVFRIEAVLSLIGVQYSRNFTRRGLRLVHFRPPRIPVTSEDPWNSIRFSLSGFWDSVSGKLCMIGKGSGKLNSNQVVLKLDYLNSSSIFNSLVNGTLESTAVSNGNGFNLNSISILGVNLRNYNYELIDREIESQGFSMLDDMTNISFGVDDLRQKACTYILSAGIVELEYRSDCSSVNCNFLRKGNDNFMPSVMFFDEIACSEDGRMRFLLGFGDFGHNLYQLPFEPNVTLVAEGKWDEKKRRLNMVGCHIFTHWDEGFVGGCSVRLSLRFPARWTLRDRSAVVGELWSSRSINESGYFGRVLLSSMKNKYVKAANLRYEYTEIEKSRKYCAKKTIKEGGGKYPNALSPDMRFDMVGSNKKVEDLWGYSSPLYVDNQFYQVSPVFGREAKSNWQGKKNFSEMINVSYILSLASSHDFKLSREYTQINSFEISAEGTYDSKNGHLCMTGCMGVRSPEINKHLKTSLDCEILVDIQYPPLHARNGGAVRGTIESTRNKSDNLYFEPFMISARSIYSGQAKESIWRVDLEITMVLISSTLSCICLGLQLLHVKRHEDAPPFISVIMLVLLTLGHLIPLLLNFEALFMTSRNNANVHFGSDGWLEVNEVFVRVIIMVAFLLEFRLLQITWSARSGDGSHENLWMHDKKVLYLSLPIYIGGGLIALFVHLSRKSYRSPSSRIYHLGHKQQSLWGTLKSYAGLVLDGFLLPQTLFNIFSDSKQKALAPSFYVGITLVRLLPHAYDLYRSHSPIFLFNYIYANPRLDYYSTTWDLIISIGGLVFVILMYLQQRHGGRCLLPKTLWQRFTYEKIPVATTV